MTAKNMTFGVIEEKPSENETTPDSPQTGTPFQTAADADKPSRILIKKVSYELEPMMPMKKCLSYQQHSTKARFTSSDSNSPDRRSENNK